MALTTADYAGTVSRINLNKIRYVAIFEGTALEPAPTGEPGDTTDPSLTLALTVPASALDYNIDGPGDPEYGKSTSIEPVVTADRGELPNVDVSKNAALIPPTFGSPTAYTLNTSNPLTPNLAPGYMLGEGAVINGNTGITVAPPDFNTIPSGIVSGNGTTSESTATPTPSTGFTEVTPDRYYKGGYLATQKIHSLNVNVKVYEGTGSSVLAKGAGHFEDTSIWDGNCAIAGHNRGANCYFGDIHNLNVGDSYSNSHLHCHNFHSGHWIWHTELVWGAHVHSNIEQCQLRQCRLRPSQKSSER